MRHEIRIRHTGRLKRATCICGFTAGEAFEDRQAAMVDAIHHLEDTLNADEMPSQCGFESLTDDNEVLECGKAATSVERINGGVEPRCDEHAKVRVLRLAHEPFAGRL